jgi:hypothetical protein
MIGRQTRMLLRHYLEQGASRSALVRRGGSEDPPTHSLHGILILYSRHSGRRVATLGSCHLWQDRSRRCERLWRLSR